ncbi:MAG TPA: hypothetical protein VMG10_16420 [Gemmataceae bacterium]|nr:hypothetical protein [Gemmataceae bacterium]
MSPTLALAYLFWTQHRRGLTLLGGYWLVVMILCLALPAGAFTLPPGESLPPVLMAVVFPCSCLVAAAWYLILVFTFGREAWLEACESGFPARLWTLPLPTHVLVGWPMLWGSAMLTLVWLTLAWAVRGLCSFDVPLVWPGLLLAVLLAWWQAILWTPFPLPSLRFYLLVPVSTVLLCTPMAVLAFDVPSIAVYGLLAILLSDAYITALRGVTRARCGDNVQWTRPAPLRWPRPSRTHPPFTSAARAQLWFEWRLHGLAFLVPVAFCVSILPPMMFQNIDMAVLSTPSLIQERGHLWMLPAIEMVVILSMVWASGMEMSKLGRTYRLPSYLATRPVSEAMLLRVKFVVAAWTTLAGWCVLAIGLLLWLALGGYAAEKMAQLFEAMRQRHEPGLFWGWLIFLVGGAVVLTWLQMVQQMWTGLSGKMRVIESWGVFSNAAFVGQIFFGFWLAQHPEYWPVFNRLLPWLAGAAVILKSLAAVWSLRALRRRALIPSGVLWGMLALWFTLALGAFAALYALLPDDWFSVPGVILGIMLLLPLTRLALAPLALAWNRHR